MTGDKTVSRLNGFEVPIRVVFGDCDPAEIVYFPNFYAWFDQATHDMCAAAGYAMQDIRAQRGWVGYPIAEAGARFLSPASFDDQLLVITRVSEWRRKMFLLEHQVWRDDTLLAEGWQTRFIGIKDDGRLRALEIPVPFREAVDSLFVVT